MFSSVIKRLCLKPTRIFNVQNAKTVPVARCLSCSCVHFKSKETELSKQLRAKIRMSGPLTVADYMREVLTNPVAGYYMHRDVFGSKGDFITSPEISQMFGEIIGIWVVNEWMVHGSPPRLRIVELGPGRGTLIDDMLRVFAQFEGIRDAVSVDLVEVSPTLIQMQYQKLCGHPLDPKDIGDKPVTCHSKYGPTVSWHPTLQQVPKEFSFYIGHEFFDALPIHKFQKKDGKWHEILIDVDDSEKGPHHLRFVLSPRETVTSKLLLKIDVDESRDHIEFCPEGGVIVNDIAERIAEHGGFSLIADYGHTGEKSDTFRAFKEHQLHDVLDEPGIADLTADVDFSYLCNVVKDKVVTYGPVSQESFLHNMGIGVRLQVLLGKADNEQRKSLITGYDMLTNHTKMGERFKFLGLLQKSTERPADYVPAGFKKL